MNTLYQQDTLDYYNHNALAYVQRTELLFPIDALAEFVSLVPSRGHILDVGCGSGRDLIYFNSSGFQVEGIDFSSEMVRLATFKLKHLGIPIHHANLMFFSFPKEKYDGIWAHRLLIHFNAEACQRALAIFFASLKSKGILFVSFEEGDKMVTDYTDNKNGPGRPIYQYQVNKISSLIRQSGFRLLSVGRDLKYLNRIGFIAQRI